MKLEIEIDPRLAETRVHIAAPAMNRELTVLQALLENGPLERLVGLRAGEARLLETAHIIRFYTDEKKVWAETKDGAYELRLRLYELEEKCNPQNFIRVSQGELLNLDYVKRLDLSLKATIAVELKTGGVCYVSRRCLANFRQALGL